MQYTGISPELVTRLKDAIENADAILVGAGAGLSTAAGFSYAGDRFRRFFSDFINKYRFRDMYTAGFYPFPTKEEFWAYWSRYILINRFENPPKPVYPKLLNLVKDHDYFVLTTNVDHCFQKAGFDKKRLFYTQGDYGLFQCSVPCHSKTYDNEETIRQMVAAQKDMRVPPELIPKCPVCGEPLTMNLRSDDRFVEDEGWHEAAERYNRFLAAHTGKVLFLEFGVGFNTPGIIKLPFWQMTAENKNALFATVNFNEAVTLEEIKDRSIMIEGDIGEVLKDLKNTENSL
jgi:NAD-dependent SIR2 family protein deacetylase